MGRTDELPHLVDIDGDGGLEAEDLAGDKRVQGAMKLARRDGQARKGGIPIVISHQAVEAVVVRVRFNIEVGISEFLVGAVGLPG